MGVAGGAEAGLETEICATGVEGLGEGAGPEPSTVRMSPLFTGCMYISTGDCWMEPPAAELIEVREGASSEEGGARAVASRVAVLVEVVRVVEGGVGECKGRSGRFMVGCRGKPFGNGFARGSGPWGTPLGLPAV